jgi:hypothetical protein
MSKTNQDPARVAQRKSEAKARQEIYDGLLPAQRLEKLDMKFGAGQGAKKERAKLTGSKPVQKTTTKPNNKLVTQYEELDTHTLPDEVMQEIAALNEETNNKKKLKAKDRRARESKV